jgi:hypothetical protein
MSGDMFSCHNCEANAIGIRWSEPRGVAQQLPVQRSTLIATTWMAQSVGSAEAEKPYFWASY